MHDERLPVVDPEGVVDSSIHLVDSVVDADELLSEFVIHLCKCRIQRAEPFVDGVEPFAVLVEPFVVLVEASVEVFAQTIEVFAQAAREHRITGGDSDDGADDGADKHHPGVEVHNGVPSLIPSIHTVGYRRVYACEPEIGQPEEHMWSKAHVFRVLWITGASHFGVYGC